MREGAVRLLLVLHPQQRGQFPHGLVVAVQQDPLPVQLALGAVAGERAGRVARDVEGYQHKPGLRAHGGGEPLPERLHVGDEQRTGIAAGSEEQAEHDGPAAEGAEREGPARVVREAGVELVDRVPAEGRGFLGRAAGARRGGGGGGGANRERDQGGEPAREDEFHGSGGAGRSRAQRKPSAVVVLLAWSDERRASRMKAA